MLHKGRHIISDEKLQMQGMPMDRLKFGNERQQQQQQQQQREHRVENGRRLFGMGPEEGDEIDSPATLKELNRRLHRHPDRAGGAGDEGGSDGKSESGGGGGGGGGPARTTSGIPLVEEADRSLNRSG